MGKREIEQMTTQNSKFVPQTLEIFSDVQIHAVYKSNKDMVVFEVVYEVIFGLECHVASDWHTQISPLIA